jgi:DNA-binding NtrC family response regulator
MAASPHMESGESARRVLIASPNADFRRQILESLRAVRWAALEALGGADTLSKLETDEFQILLLDHWLPDLEVTELVALVRDLHPDIAVYVVDATNATPLISEEPEGHSYREAVQKLLATVRKPGFVLASLRTKAAPAPVEPAISNVSAPLPDMVGVSPAMQEVYRLVRLVAQRNTTVLITGATGTGKELVARAVHLVGPRERQPFITVNCAAIPEPLLESELFGYARGAFTGAFQARTGRIHSAHGGTLFLDEVGELPLSMQAKLLRFLQEGEVQRLGSPDVVRVDVRVIAATNANLEDRVREKAFREDLYYRLSVFPIDIQPLRKRVEDIMLLAQRFLGEFCLEAGTPEKSFTDAARTMLEQHAWPGNVRELRHVIERAFILSEGSLDILPEHIRMRSVHRLQ